jgi:hypothetical protein
MVEVESPHLPRQASIHQAVQSPLFMALHDPVLHQFISYLTRKKEEQEQNPDLHVRIELSAHFIAQVRESFRQNILQGERLLHVLSHLLSSTLLEGDFELHSNVIGVLPGDEERPFHIRERINRETLFSFTDIDLGNQMLGNFRYFANENWMPLELSANFVEYIPIDRTTTGANRLTSRVKAEEELWNKVTDEIFQMDELVRKDKHLRQYSKYVKDIFGIKVVCEDDAACQKAHELMLNLDESDFSIERAGISEFDFPVDDGTLGEISDALEFIETKDYLTCDPAQMKKTGWRAIKSVVKWHGRLFEIQFQPLSNYYLELDHMAGPSHSSFKLKRDALRDEVSRQLPLYGFYRDLLKMLFLESEISFECDNASVVIT